MNEKMSGNNKPILEIQNLRVAYRQGNFFQDAVRNVSLTLQAGQTMGIVGESGSGKTTLALAVMGYLPEEGMVIEGEVRFKGRNLMGMDRKEMRKYWGKGMSFVPQNALESLNPSIRLGDQVAENLRSSFGFKKDKAWKRTIELFEMVHLADPKRVARAYPFQLSAGMLQRVLTAMAISTEPNLLVLDEPTSNLDVTTQAAMLDLFGELIHGQSQTTVLYISHDLGVVARICDWVAVMYAGDLVEIGSTSALYQQALHPYTQGLLDCVPRLGENKTSTHLRSIEGRIPAQGERPSGCAFRTRCPLAIDICEDYPPLYQTDGARSSRCHRWEEIKAGRVDSHQPEQVQERVQVNLDDTQDARIPVLEIENLVVQFSENRSLLEFLRRQQPSAVKVVNGVDLKVDRGTVVGFVGESGSGKTTLANAVVGLVERTSGDILLFNETLPPKINERTKDTISSIQVVFQNPSDALNPYLSVGHALRRPLKRFRNLSDEEIYEAVVASLDAVNLPAEYATRLPGQMSGGELQRVAIARAFASSPEVLIADEPVSSLDVSVQASILNLFYKLQADQNFGMLFISHDLSVVGYLADKIAVIYFGQLMEVSPVAAAFDPPHHPYTEALLSSVPLIYPAGGPGRIRLEEGKPKLSEEIRGCPFHTRCPRFLGEICIEKLPPWWIDETSGKLIYCHIPRDELLDLQGQTSGLSKTNDLD